MFDKIIDFLDEHNFLIGMSFLSGTVCLQLLWNYLGFGG